MCVPAAAASQSGHQAAALARRVKAAIPRLGAARWPLPLRLVMHAPAARIEEIPGSLRREIAMTAAADTGLAPMRVSKAVALGDGDGICE